jgi:hypothetical protein
MEIGIYPGLDRESVKDGDGSVGVRDIESEKAAEPKAKGQAQEISY